MTSRLKAVGLAGLLLAVAATVWLLFSTTDEPTPSPDEREPLAEEEGGFLRTIGHSVEGRPIEVYSYGEGDRRVLLVGGMHGGYEWNSILLAYEMIDHLEANPEFIPAGLAIDIIPNLNPDGLFLATGLSGRFAATQVTDHSMHETGTGRFNANGVDLNRNFACRWAPESSWRGRTVSAGSAAFSEPEAAALRDFVAENRPAAVIFWHSQANNVYASECEDGPLPLTLTLMNAYAKAAYYGAVPSFDAYPITGDAEGWLASLSIPALTVELETRTSTEWQRNLTGVEAILAELAD